MVNMAQFALKHCDICIENRTLYNCVECSQNFYGTCKTSHLRSYFSRNHQFPAVSSISSVESDTVCREHHERYNFVCVRCQEALCQHCIVGNNIGHTIAMINDALCNMKFAIENERSRKLKSIEKCLSDLWDTKEANKINVPEIFEVIIQTGNKIKDKVDQQVSDLL